jgi:TIR domain
MTDKKFNVFISHSSQDQEFVDKLAQSLESEGVTVWSERSIQPDSNWTEAIEEGLEQSRHILLVVSPESLNSPWANFETGMALSMAAKSPDTLVIPVFTQNVDHQSLPFSTKNRISVNAVNMNPGELGVKLHQILTDHDSAHRKEIISP